VDETNLNRLHCATILNTLVFYTTDNGAWQDVYPDAGYTPFRGTKGTVREGGNRRRDLPLCSL
jgi:arylsulfatase A-like enzyme